MTESNERTARQRPDFDRLARRYDRAMIPLELLLLRRWRRRLVGNLEGRRVLEIGAGTGANFPFLHQQRTIVALDASIAMLRKAARRSDRPPGLKLVVASVEALPFRDAAFDAALATLVFCSVDDPHAGLRDVRRVLLPGAHLRLIEHVRPGGPLGFFFDLIDRISVPLTGEHFARRTPEIVAAAGFELQRVVNIGTSAVRWIEAVKADGS